MAFEPNQSVKISSTSGTFPITVTRSVKANDANSCTVQALVQGDPSGIFSLAKGLMRRMVQKSVNEDYARLKVLLESAT